MCLVGLFSFVVLRTELGDILDAKPLSYTSILRAGVIHSLIHSCGEGNAGTHVRGTTCRGSLFHHGFRGMKLGPQSCTARFKTTTTTTTTTTKTTTTTTTKTKNKNKNKQKKKKKDQSDTYWKGLSNYHYLQIM